MSTSDRQQPQESRIVHLCSKGGCCPDAEFLPDKSVAVTDGTKRIVLTRIEAEALLEKRNDHQDGLLIEKEGISIEMSRDSAAQFFDEMERRGYGW